MNRRKNFHISASVCAVVLLAICAIFTPSCARQEYRTVEGMAWNTTFHITYQGERDLTDSVYAVLHRVEMSVSAFAPQSIVSRINRGETRVTDAAFRTVYNKARQVWQNSRGRFDPTVSPLINAYGFGFTGGDSVLPSQRETDSLLQFVGMGRTHLQGTELVKEDARTQFNFSAIAKGYGCDQVGEMLRRNGVENYMVEIGGELSLHGHNPEGGLWRISIDKPVFSADREIHESQQVLELTDCGVATSGNYRNYHELEGRRVSHTIDPVTGRPSQTDLLSATVIAPTCMEADAYATAFMSMGSREAMTLARRLHLRAILITGHGVLEVR